MDTLEQEGRIVPGELVIKLKNEKPIRAGELGRLLSAMANDYRRAAKKKSELLLVRAEEGSLVLGFSVLVAVVGGSLAVATAANTLIEFGKNIGELLGKARAGTERLAHNKRIGSRPAQELLQLAIDSQATVELTHEIEGDAERTFIRITPTEASEIQRRETSPPLVVKTAQQALPPPQVASLPSPDVDFLINQLDARRLLSSNSFGNASEERDLIRTILEILRSSQMYYDVETIAAQLEARGYYAAAQLFRQEESRGKNDLEPPLLGE